MATYTPTYTEETPSASATTGAITGKVSKAIDTMAWIASVTASINQLFFKTCLSLKEREIPNVPAVCHCDCRIACAPLHEPIRHCERSEAIHDPRMHGSPRFARDDGSGLVCGIGPVREARNGLASLK